MSKAKVYIETSVISYLTARPSRDIVTAGHQQTTRDWWQTRRQTFAVTEEALLLAQTLLEPGPLPKKAAEDALHVAIAATNGIQFLLTWNCKHLANATTRPVVEHICRTQGYEPVIICTPEELLEE